jgi:hypothetical protein
LSSGKPRRRGAQELGVSDGSLRKWEKDLPGGSAGEGRAVGEADKIRSCMTDHTGMARDSLLKKLWDTPEAS